MNHTTDPMTIAGLAVVVLLGLGLLWATIHMIVDWRDSARRLAEARRRRDEARRELDLSRARLQGARAALARSHEETMRILTAESERVKIVWLSRGGDA